MGLAAWIKTDDDDNDDDKDDDDDDKIISTFKQFLPFRTPEP